MIKYHAVLSSFMAEFSAEVQADSVESALDWLDENYPESYVVEIGDSEYWRQQEIQRYKRLESEYY